ncbi:MAG TPA: MlaD family protein [Desulfuromonadales bacterium]|nr:MlaD family protein [Desulfuromonadales bacterium]
MAMSTEKKVGLFFLCTLIALAVMIELVQGWHPFEHQTQYKAYFTSAVGIKNGDPVRLAGVDVGKITHIVLEDGKVRVDFYVMAGTAVRSDSLAEIRQTNLLGGQFLGISFGTPTSPVLPSGATVKTRENGNIDQLISDFDRNQHQVLTALGDLIEQSKGPFVDALNRLDQITRKIDQGQGTLGKLVNDPALYDQLQGSVTDLKLVLDKLQSGQGTLGRLMNDPALYNETTATMGNLHLISQQIADGKGTIGRLVQDDSLYVNASDSLASFKAITLKINKGEGTLGKLVNDSSLYDSTTSTMGHINSIAAKIDKGHGTLGKLVNQDDLYRDAKTTLNKVEKAVDGLNDTGPLSALGQVAGTLF